MACPGTRGNKPIPAPAMEGRTRSPPRSPRRKVRRTRPPPGGHTTGMAQKLGPVPARPDAAQQWRDAAVSIEMFRARYNVPETDATPVPERLRNEEIGQQLHDQAVTVSKRSHALPEHTTDQDRTLDALAAVERSKDTHAPPSHPRSAQLTRTGRPTPRSPRPSPPHLRRRSHA